MLTSLPVYCQSEVMEEALALQKRVKCNSRFTVSSGDVREHLERIERKGYCDCQLQCSV